MVPRVQSTHRGPSTLTSGQVRRGDTHRTLLTGRLDSTMAVPELDAPFRDDVAAPVDKTVLCDSCPHPVAAHDRVARRYCDATLRMVLPRGCICRGDLVDTDKDPAPAHRFP